MTSHELGVPRWKKKGVGCWVCRVWECNLLCRRHLNNNWEYIPILKKGLAIGYVAYECVTCFVGDISRIGCAPLKKKGVGCWVCRVWECNLLYYRRYLNNWVCRVWKSTLPGRRNFNKWVCQVEVAKVTPRSLAGEISLGRNLNIWVFNVWFNTQSTPKRGIFSISSSHFYLFIFTPTRSEQAPRMYIWERVIWSIESSN